MELVSIAAAVPLLVGSTFVHHTFTLVGVNTRCGPICGNAHELMPRKYDKLVNAVRATGPMLNKEWNTKSNGILTRQNGFVLSATAPQITPTGATQNSN
jgi:hypothetical protein